MTSNQYPESFDDTPMITIDVESEPPGPPGSGLDLYEQALEKRLAEECNCNEDRIRVLRETFARLKSRTNPPEQNIRDFDRIVRYLLSGRFYPDPPESSS
jgi:hypothetical protein